MRRISAALAPDSNPITSGTTLPWTRTRHCSMEAGKALRVSSRPAVTKQRVVQRFHIAVRRSRYSGGTACRYVRSLRYLRYSPADRPQLLRQRRFGRKSRGHPVEARRLAPYRASLFAEIRIFDLSQTEVSAEGIRFYFHV